MKRLTHRRLLVIAGVACGLALAVTAYLYLAYGDQLPPLGEVREWVLHLLQTIPAPAYFLAFALLPACGVPLTIFYLTAIPVLGQAHPLLGIVLALVAVGLNMMLSYWLAIGILHPAIEWVIRHRHLRIPKISRENEVQIVLALRVSPVPFAIQNYLLALGHARLRSYIGLSLPIQGSVGVAMMIVGESILKGGFGYVLMAVFVLLVLTLVLKILRKRLKRVPVEENC